MRTIIGVCLDESGSMGEDGKRDAAISAFNEYLHEQQRVTADECHMAVARFNTVARVSDRMAPVASMADLSRTIYVPGGSTALFDAIAYTVREIERGISDDDRIVLVVLTDGEENASKETTLAQVKELIAAKESTKRWTFVYLSASPDAFAQGASMGIAAGNVANYVNTGQGVAHAMSAMSGNVRSYRMGTATASASLASGASNAPRRPVAAPVAPSVPTQPAKTETDMWGNR